MLQVFVGGHEPPSRRVPESTEVEQMDLIVIGRQLTCNPSVSADVLSESVDDQNRGSGGPGTEHRLPVGFVEPIRVVQKFFCDSQVADFSGADEEVSHLF